MSKVFIIQEPMKRDKETGEMVPMMNFKSAMDYGDLITCLPPGRVSLSPVPMVRKLVEALKDFSDDDYIVPVGDPTAIAAASAIAAKNNLGRLKILKWDRDYKRYIMVQLFTDPSKASIEGAV